MSATLAVNLLDPHSLLASFGPLGVGVVLFAETGLLIGFFLPGDSLLFTAGSWQLRRPARRCMCRSARCWSQRR